MTFRTRCTILVAVVISIATGATSAHAADGRIIGGDKVPQATYDSTYSAVVSVRNSSNFWGPTPRRVPDVVTHTCGGTVIAPRLVLTAAHCVATIFPIGTGPGLTVLAGDATLSKRTASAGTRVTAVYIHPEYDGNDNDLSFFWGPNEGSPANDLAVLRLAAPIDGVTPMRLVSASEDAAAWGAGEGRPSGAITLGWGVTRVPGNRSTRQGTLHSVGLAIRADRRCERSDDGLGGDATNFERESMLCAGTVDGPGPGTARSACYGDSGGPLLAPVADGSLRIVGVTSWTPSRNPCRTWSVYTRVAALRDWVNSIPADEGGAGGLLAPREVTASSTADGKLRLEWSASPSANATRYRVSRAAKLPYFGPWNPSFLIQTGSTDAAGRSLVLDGVEPQRPGQSERRLVRVDVEDAVGNRVAGRVTRVAAPIDSAPPTRPASIRFLDRRERRGESLLLPVSRDNDCVAGYTVQVNTDRGWRDIGRWTNRTCDPIFSQGPFGYGYSPRPSKRIILPLRKLGPGRHWVRAVVFDRAGNGVTSPALHLDLDEQVRGVRPGSCLTGNSQFCSPSRFRGGFAYGVSVVIR